MAKETSDGGDGGYAFSKYYKKTVAERLAILKKEKGLSDEEVALFQKQGDLPIEVADRMVENVVGTFSLPFGIATNFIINGKEYVVPMVLEEPSVVAAASNAAKLCRPAGFTTSSDEPVMIGQVQLTDVLSPQQAVQKIHWARAELMESANSRDATLVKHGGGVRGIEAHVAEAARGKNVVVHVLVDVRDAMGANAVNTMVEAIAPKLEEITGGRACLRILSNLAVHRKARAKAVWTRKALEDGVRREFTGGAVVDGIIDAYNFAVADQYRATTHNKGIMNGIDAVCIATGQDWRAIEAGAHSFAAMGGKYRPFTKFYKNAQEDLVGEIELPMATGIVGGATKTHPLARVALKILGIKSAQELGQVIAAVGLAQNLAALRALATEGIQRGHMRLHARNISVTAGAKGAEIDKVASLMVQEGNVRVDRGQKLLEELRSGGSRDAKLDDYRVPVD